jgi:hypothetical protein
MQCLYIGEPDAYYEQFKKSKKKPRPVSPFDGTFHFFFEEREREPHFVSVDVYAGKELCCIGYGGDFSASVTDKVKVRVYSGPIDLTGMHAIGYTQYTVVPELMKFMRYKIDDITNKYRIGNTHIYYCCQMNRKKDTMMVRMTCEEKHKPLWIKDFIVSDCDLALTREICSGSLRFADRNTCINVLNGIMRGVG